MTAFCCREAVRTPLRQLSRSSKSFEVSLSICSYVSDYGGPHHSGTSIACYKSQSNSIYRPIKAVRSVERLSLTSPAGGVIRWRRAEALHVLISNCLGGPARIRTGVLKLNLRLHTLIMSLGQDAPALRAGFRKDPARVLGV